jgi:GT2 family glycosyltransferase
LTIADEESWIEDQDKVAVLIASRNRRAQTLASLASLKMQSKWSICHVYRVDNGSTDGTAEAVLGEPGPRVNVVRGNGKHYWISRLNRRKTGSS